MTCELCDDTRWKPVEVDGVRRVERCECWRALLTSKLLSDAGIPPRYRKCDLDSFRDNNDSLAAAVRKARRFADGFPVVDKGLFFLGKPGLGKTHLSVAIVKEVIRRTNAHALFYDVRELLKEIRNTYNPAVRSTESQVIQPVMEAELLVLDDLGAEKTSEWVDETLNLIVNTRYNERRATIFSSNYPVMEDLRDPDNLVVRVGYRMWSRLQEMCEFVELKSVDYRELGPDATPDQLSELDKKGSASHRLPSPAGRNNLAKAQLRKPTDKGRDLGWSGGKAGS
jgi:DNA replication protein DnaC